MRTEPSGVARSADQWEPFMASLRARLGAERRHRRARRVTAWALALAGALALAAALEQEPPGRGHLLMARVPLAQEAGFQAVAAEARRLPSGAWLVAGGGGAP